jgi:hypothetical protein
VTGMGRGVTDDGVEGQWEEGHGSIADELAVGEGGMAR